MDPNRPNWLRITPLRQFAERGDFVRERLGAPSDSENESGALAIADAQLLVARANGFESWAQLTKHI